jgi:hypothetical protein
MGSARHLDKEFTEELHRRLLDDDPVAPTEAMECMYEPLVRRLATSNPAIWQLDYTIITDAVVDALTSYIKRPQQFQPERGGLFAYLVMSARGDLRNALARLRREQVRQVSFDPVAHDRGGGNPLMDSSGDLAPQEHSPGIRALCRAVQQVRRELDSREQEVLDLMIDGERRTAVFARVLHLGDRTPAEQEREVKRVKDRIKRRIMRRRDALLGRTAK